MGWEGRRKDRQSVIEGQSRVPRSQLREPGLGLGRNRERRATGSRHRNTAAGQEGAVVSTGNGNRTRRGK